MAIDLFALGPMLARTAALIVISAAQFTLAQIPEPTDAPEPLTPEMSAASFALPDGFRMEIVASEPLIASPSGICWDAHGQMFVSELHGYNLEGQLDIEELNKTGQLDTQVRRVQADERFKQAAKSGTFGVVKKLRDSDGDGRMDMADIWASDLPPAYGLVPYRDGVIIACAPDIIYLADRDGDGDPEIRETLFSGFGTGALERGINAPQWGGDGWIYFARGWGGGKISGPRLARPVELPHSDFRIRADGSAIEPVTGHSHTFGFAMTSTGDRFTVTTTTAFCVAPLPWHYLIRNPDAATGDLMQATGDRRAYSISQPHPWRRKRAEHPAYFEYYRSRYGAAESEPDGWFTAMCGPLVYQDHVLPGLHGQFFSCEPSGNLIHRAVIEPEGTTLNLRRAPGEEKSEFAASSDPWSHPMHLLHGPDGALWVVDYYREIIEDYSAIPRHLQQQYSLYHGHDRGRIYRLTHRDAQPPPPVDMGRLGAARLARECASPLLWRRYTAQRLLVERREVAAAPVLRTLMDAKDSAASTLITCLRTLDQLGVLEAADVIPMVNHTAAAVRTEALRIGDRWLRSADQRALLDAVLSAAGDEKDARTRIQFALSLGESPDPRALTMLTRYAREHLDLRWMETALLSSLAGRGAAMLAELVREPGAASPLIRPLARAVAARLDESELRETLELIATADPVIQATVLAALVDGRKNTRRKPVLDVETHTVLASLAASPELHVRTAARDLEESFVASSLSLPGGDANTLVPPDPEISDATFRTFLTALDGPRDADRGHEIFQESCMICHRVGEEGHAFGPDLQGELGVAEETLVRHLLAPNERIRPGYETILLDTNAGAPLVGLLRDDGATSITLAQPGGVETVVLRKDVKAVRRLALSLMPSFSETINPADLASLLTWLRTQLKPELGQRLILFDEEPKFAILLNEESGTAKIEGRNAAFGRFCLRISPPQQAARQIPGWDFSIVKHPSAPNQFRYLRLSWRAKGHGVMIELANSGRWPSPDVANGRYFAGSNTTGWQARETSNRPPREWETVTLDLWKDIGEFTLTGIAPTAMGDDAWFDRIELLRKR